MMPRFLVRAAAAVLCVAAPLLAAAQWYTGWSQQTGLALSLHIDGDTGSLYSPMQSPDPLPVSRWQLRADTLRIECASLGFRTTLAFCREADSVYLQGTWRQGLLREAITFNPADTLYQLRRPQTPQRPYPFCEDTIAVDYTDSQGNAVHLEGTLAYPRGEGRCPCLVLVSGSGQQNRDEELLFHRPFLVLASYLAQRGIATLRYDDRGIGSSRGPLDSADTRLFAEDAEAMLLAAVRHARVDTLRLGIGGHSEGGVIAPMVAARCPKAKFVVMLAGLGLTGSELLVEQNRALFAARGVSAALAECRASCMAALFALPEGASVKDMQAVILRHSEGLSRSEADSIDLRKGMAYTLKQQLDTRWMRTFLQLDPAEYLPQLRCPVLALNGDRDCQVTPPNLHRIADLCPDQVQAVLVPGVNHLFQYCHTGSPDEYVRIEQTLAPEVMQLVADWILSL